MGAEVKHQTVTEVPEGAVLRSEEDLAPLVAFRRALGLGRPPLVRGDGAKNQRTGEQALVVDEETETNNDGVRE